MLVKNQTQNETETTTTASEKTKPKKEVRAAKPAHCKAIKKAILRQFAHRTELTADEIVNAYGEHIRGNRLSYFDRMLLLIAWSENEYEKSEWEKYETFSEADEKSHFSEFVRDGREGFSRQQVAIGKNGNGEIKTMTLGAVDSQLWGETFKRIRGLNAGKGRKGEVMPLLVSIEDIEREELAEESFENYPEE